MSAEPRDPIPPTEAPPPAREPIGDVTQPAPVEKLTPDEQMALFEKELKENDWGHQPC